MHYKLPELKSDGNDTILAPQEYERRITIPVNQEILDAAEVGAECTFILKGKLVGLRSSVDDDHTEANVTLEVTDVTKDNYDEDEDAFSRGFGRMNKNHTERDTY